EKLSSFVSELHYFLMTCNSRLLVIFLFFVLAHSELYAQDSCEDGNLAACACEEAPVLCSLDELDGYVRQMSSTSRPEDGPTPICPGTATATHNPTWFAFTAWCNTLTLRASFSNCTGGTGATGAQLAVFTDCSFNEVVVCNADVNYCNIPVQDMTMNGLNIGQVYYIMLDGCNGAVCEAAFEIIGDCGEERISPWPYPTIYGTQVVCQGDNENYSVFRPDGARQYFWYLDGVLFEETESENLNIEWPEGGTFELCVDVGNEPCVPRETDPFEICTTITVVGPNAGDINTEGAESVCPGESINISVFGYNDVPPAEQIILIVDEDGFIIEEFFGSEATWRPLLDGNYSIYSVNYSPDYFFPPGPGTHIDDIGCLETCCDMTMVPLFVGNPIIALESQVNIDCNTPTGSVTVSASSGAPYYQYSINNGPFQNSGTFTGLAAGTYTVTVRDGSYCQDMMQVTITENIPELINSVTFDPTTCGQANGRIVVSSSFSDVTYALNSGSFQSSNTFNNIAAGTYTVRVRNSEGCEDTENVVVTNIAGPQLALASQVNIDCNTPTGSLTVNATEGTPPYQYSLDGTNYQNSNTFTGLAAGTYTVRARDQNNCIDQLNTTITANLYDVIDNVSSTPAACNQATGSISVSSSAPGARYALNGGPLQDSNVFNNQSPGTYTVRVVDSNGCSDTRMVTVGNTPGPSLALNNQVNIDCLTPTGSLTVRASGGTAPYMYSIDNVNFQNSNTFTGLAAGSYRVQVRDANNCFAEVSAEITATFYDLIDEIVPTPANCNQANGQININSSAPNPQFALDNGPFQTSNTFTGLAAGTYTITVRDANGCTESQDLVLNNLNGPSLSLANQVNIDCHNPDGIITVSATSGTEPYEYSLNSGNYQSSNVFDNLRAGNYTVTIRDANACTDMIAVEITENLYPLIDDVSSTPTACSEAVGTITVQSSASDVMYWLNDGPMQTENTFTNLAAGGYIVHVRDGAGCEASQAITVENPGGPQISLDSQVNIDCLTPTGSLTVSVSSGVGPFEYSIDGTNYQSDNTFTGLSAGTYSVQVRDANQCVDAVAVEITANLYELIDDIDLVASACGQAIGSITVNSSANGMRYALDGGPFQTSNVFTNVAAGPHTIDVIDENMCEASQEITLDDLPGPTAAVINQVNIDCNTPTGSITLGATSGTGPYQYSIDGTNFQDNSTFSGLAVGNYTFYVRDANNCMDQLAVEVTANLYDLIDEITIQPAACQQAIGTITVSSSANGMRYALDGGPFQTSNVFIEVPPGEHIID
ncbi:MAG: hypothetical protein D6772_09050, partial [Bacteroidetes bacterium]